MSRRQAPRGNAGTCVRPFGPMEYLRTKLADALNPDLAPRPVARLADMSTEKQAEMRRLYERKAR